MNKAVARYLVLNIGLLTLLMLIILSIAGAFLGAEKARLFFNSPPLAVLWILLTAILIAGFIFWKSLYLRPYMLLCHLGCIAVLLGALWGSAAAHQFRTALGLPPKLTKGAMMLRQGRMDNKVYPESSNTVFELPYTVLLTQTSVTHYDDPSIDIFTPQGILIIKIPPIVGQSFPLSPEGTVTVQVTARFNNLRLIPTDQGSVAQEGPSDRINPGYEVLFQMPDGTSLRQYVFELFEPHFHPDTPFLARFSAPKSPKEYQSTLVLEKDGRTLTQKTIRVNDPLHYDGYHFYQNTFGRDEIGPYSGIMVVSDTGVWAVFAGYAAIILGLIGQFWIQPLVRRHKSRKGGQ